MLKKYGAAVPLKGYLVWFSRIFSYYILQLNGTPLLLQYLLILFEESVVLMLLSRKAVVSRLRLAVAVPTISGAVASGQPAF